MQLHYIPQFFVKQKIALTVNRFEVLAANPDGTLGNLICFAEQKRLAFREHVIFYADASRTRPVFSFKARNVMDLNGRYDIFDENMQPLAYFNKDFAASFFRSTFHVEGPGYAGTGQERNQIVALLRRFSETYFLPIHFDYMDVNGSPLVSIERQWALRDKYTVNVPDQRVDFRVAAALAVGMDVLMQR
ncbi:hypothetical protein M3G03_01275 [Aestuariimicrobium sp. p3-SID1156]|uniref:hypothetical protein n=1 Tax=Aestuariimicrobium sp. p3-SID1156 TaxID=2916038 RepID=UPI00223C2474|nr:hypothetical protein [Aestuariimicrobium sp. p3-SID1156]MCT1458186.1 hypothetical protein [Aestuariimicrobium sp. p3-SID1156]